MISKVTENFDKQFCVAKTSGKHTVSSKKDMDITVNELVERNSNQQKRPQTLRVHKKEHLRQSI